MSTENAVGALATHDENFFLKGCVAMRVRSTLSTLVLLSTMGLQAQGPAAYDLLIRNARIVDGTASRQQASIDPYVEPDDYEGLPTAPLFRALCEIERAGLEVDFSTLGERTSGAAGWPGRPRTRIGRPGGLSAAITTR